MGIRTGAAVALGASLLAVPAGCGGDAASEPRTPTLRTRAIGLSRLVTFNRPCGVVIAGPQRARYIVLASLRALCPRAKRYVAGLRVKLPPFDAHWGCQGEIRSGYCIDGAFTRGFSWDLAPRPSP